MVMVKLDKNNDAGVLIFCILSCTKKIEIFPSVYFQKHEKMLTFFSNLLFPTLLD